MTDTKTEAGTCLYTVTLPLSGTAVLQFRAASGLSYEDAIERAQQSREPVAALAVIDGGSLVEIQNWEIHSSGVNVSHPVPEVRREEE